MTTLNIGGRKVSVDDSFLKLSPEQQNATVEEIAASLGIAPAKAAPTPPEPEADNRPWYAKAGEAADDIARLAADGLTFGYADKFAGYMGGEGAEAERAKTEAARKRAGWAGTVAEIGGVVAPVAGLAKAGVTAARLVPSTLTGGSGLAARSAALGAEGAGLGALHATGHDTDVATGAGIGALAGVGGNLAGEALSAGVKKVAGAFNRQPVIPTVPELKAASHAAYDTAENAGVVFAPQGLQRVKSEIQNDLAQSGYHPKLQPRVAVVLDELDRLSNSNVSLKGVDVLRQIADTARASIDPAEKRLGSMVIGRIDDFVENMRPNEVLVGDAATGSAAIKEARALWSRMRKSETVAEAVEKATTRAESTGSGGNVNNAIRQNLRGILESKSKSRGFTADEKQALREIIRGSPTQNALRLAGKLSPSGNGLMAALGIGATAVNPLMAVAPAVGFVSKVVADQSTKRGVQELSKIIRAGGQASAARAAPNAVQRLADSKRDAVVRAMLAAGLISAP